jgi:hypothetical protein
LAKTIKELHDEAYDRVLKDLRFRKTDTGKEFELNIQDEKRPIVVLTKDPIANKYRVTRNLADGPA